LHPPGPIEAFGGPVLKRFWDQEGADLIHAWSVSGATAARASSDAALLLEVFDPAIVNQRIKRLRVLCETPRVVVSCASAIVRRRLIEGGVPPDRSVVIRPAVDFSVINRTRRAGLREAIGVTSRQLMILVAEPVSRVGGAFDAFCAAALVDHLRKDSVFVLPGGGDEANRIARFATTLPQPLAVVRILDRFAFEELAGAADVLLIAAEGDTSTTSVAWAMAGGAVVIGAAIPCVAELIAHKVNGLLFNPKAGCGPVVSIAKLLGERESFPKLREAASGQAYEVFGARRYADQHMRLYENVLEGRSASDGIADSAAAG
jgi:glycosyltransferase involved in cell wall biosynthesis